MNADHADAVARYAATAGAKDGRWRLVGIDADGVDLASEAAFRRLNYPQPIQRSEDIRKVLVQLSRAGVANATNC